MKKLYLFLLCGLLFSANLNAQTWQIGSPNAASVTATLQNGTLTIRGTGAMIDWTSQSAGGQTISNTPWWNVRTSIRTVIIETGVTNIGSWAFMGCTNLASATIPNSVTTIKTQAFTQSGLTSVTVPNSVTTIENFAFQNCGNLTSVTVERARPLILLNTAVFSGVQTSNVRLIVPKGTAEYYRNASVWRNFIVEEGNFYPSWRIGSPTPANVTATLHYDTLIISGTGAMMNWNNMADVSWIIARNSIETVIIESGVTSIGRLAFIGHSRLTSVTIPVSVITIADYAFEGCTGLTSITVGWTTPRWIDANVFWRVPTSARLHVPAGTEEAYRNHNVWGRFVIGDDAPYTWRIGSPTPANVTATLHNNTLTISGTGAMMDWEWISGIGTTAPWNAFRTSIETVIIEDGVTTIGSNAFRDCTGLTSITISNSVTTIGDDAFGQNSWLRTVINHSYTPQVLSSDGRNVFSGSTNIGLAELFVAEDRIQAFQQANGWRMFGCIKSLPPSFNVDALIAALRDSISTLQDSISTLHNDIFICESENNVLNDSILVLNDSIGTLHLIIAEWIEVTSELLDSIVWLQQLLDECEDVGVQTQDVSLRQLQIFPNPVNYKLTITNYDWQVNDVVELYDMSGRIVETWRAASLQHGEFTIDMSPFNSGNYILRIGNRVAKVVKK